MWIRDVDVPEALIDAHRNGKLVIFVGAGASRASLSDLPDFRGLTAAIAADANVTVTEQQLDHPDVLLGELEDRHEVDVHVRVAARMGVPSSLPNGLHEAIAELAVAGPSVRIVTTNYDLHLSTVFAARGLSMTEYMAPAMPMGDDFTGLVYLHGCLRQAPRALSTVSHLRHDSPPIWHRFHIAQKSPGRRAPLLPRMKPGSRFVSLLHHQTGWTRRHRH